MLYQFLILIFKNLLISLPFIFLQAKTFLAAKVEDAVAKVEDVVCNNTLLELEKAMEEISIKEKTIAQIKEEQKRTGKMILELQTMVNDQKNILAVPTPRGHRKNTVRRASNFNGTNSPYPPAPEDKIFHNIRHIFNHHNNQHEDLLEASFWNYELQRELADAHEELIKLKTMSLGRKRKDKELKFALDKNLDLQYELDKAKLELEFEATTIGTN